MRQERNEVNNRLYNLYLTDEGNAIYENHRQFEERCYQRTFHSLDGFSAEEIRTYIAIQQKINSTFAMDVEESRMLGTKRRPGEGLD